MTRREELPRLEAGTALAALEQTDHVRVEDLPAVGILYEAMPGPSVSGYCKTMAALFSGGLSLN
jgi:hypothetical protein